MTNEEAIERLKDEKRCVVGACDDTCKYWKNHECHKVEWYSTQFDAIDKAIEALEKQIPKKPLNVTDSIEDLRFDWTCPSCKRQFVGSSYGVNHCVDCGQKIDWEGEGE